ncbi:MAG: AAA family ATPase [Bryobacteraceae bacterium]|nr:AAA family ATPase [Bryobacteraceae bacterium]
MALPFLVRRVELRNYRSIEHCDVELGPLMFLVGPNGSGKSNFLDALRFVSDCLNTSVDQALRERGGFRAVCRRDNLAASFSIRLEIQLGPESTAEYFFEIGADADRTFQILRESCEIRVWQGRSARFHFKRTGPAIEEFQQPEVYGYPEPAINRLFLAFLLPWPHFGGLCSALTRMSFYNPSVEAIREYQKASNFGLPMKADGSDLVSVFRRVEQADPDTIRRVFEYLSAALPHVLRIAVEEVGEKVTFQFTEAAKVGQPDRKLYASSMSDGTLRMLALLVALFQVSKPEAAVSLVGIEEPEIGLHPGAAGVVFDSLNEAAYSRQVLVTSHSSELLDRDDVDVDTLLAVSAASGATEIGRVDDCQKEILQRRLATAGELLRDNRLAPNQAVAGVQR